MMVEQSTVCGSGREDSVSAKALVCASLLLIVFIVYSQTRKFPFIDFDDSEYVYENSVIRQGVSIDAVAWAFSTFWSANWHPITWLSHMLDVQMFGLDAGWHHLSNVLLHGLNAVSLFIVLNSMTGAIWRSAFVAALFAIHPQHVESVAWVAERKDVLSVFFWLLTMAAYVSFVRQRCVWRYFLVLLLYALGLMSKPMLVTVPLVLLLLDFWPLQRLHFGAEALGESEIRRRIPQLIWEKLPLVFLALASCIIAYAAQQSWQATAPLEGFPVEQRVSNALLSTVIYLGKTIWPVSLAVFYPHASSIGESLSITAVMTAAGALFLLTSFVTVQGRLRPWLAVGWFWFLITLAPVIGLVQVGSQAMADRYTYVPHIGLFILLSWSIPDRLGESPPRKVLAGALCGLLLLALSRVTWIQIGYWRNAAALYTHAIAVTQRNWLAWNNLGMQYLNAGEFERALSSFREAARIKPNYADAWYNAGVAQQRLGHNSQAIESYQISLTLEPRNADGWSNLGIARQMMGDFGSAIQSYENALQLRPEDPLALRNLALAHVARGDLRQAVKISERLRRFDQTGWNEVMKSLSAVSSNKSSP